MKICLTHEILYLSHLANASINCSCYCSGDCRTDSESINAYIVYFVYVGSKRSGESKHFTPARLDPAISSSTKIKCAGSFDLFFV